jgi:hypothetical protein
MVEFVSTISDRFEWDLFTLGGPTCSPACVEDNGVCASEGLRSRDEDEDNGVRASKVWRSRDEIREITCDEDNGVCASEVLRSRDDTMVVIVKAGWDAVEKLARLDAVLM